MTDDRWPAVSAAIRQRRHALGLTQAEAAQKGGLSLPTWGVVETGRQTNFRNYTLSRVTRALGWPLDAIDRLLAGESPEQIADTGQTHLDRRRQELGDDHDVMDDVVINFNAPPDQVPPEALDAIKTLLRPYFEGER